MAMIRDPLDTRKRVRINKRYDNQDVIIENALSKKRLFKDIDRADLLTQNNWNHSPFTRTDAHRDVTVINAGSLIEGRFQRYRWRLDPAKYNEPR